MKRPSVARFADEKLKIAFYSLKEGDYSDRQLFEAVHKAVQTIEQNAFSGIQLRKYLIPKEYQVKYAVKNLWKYNLPNGWRLLYSIEQEDLVIISVILEWFDHKEYERKLGC